MACAIGSFPDRSRGRLRGRRGGAAGARAGGGGSRGIQGAEEGVGEAGSVGGVRCGFEVFVEFAAGGEAAAEFFVVDELVDGFLDLGELEPGEEVVEGEAGGLGRGAEVVVVVDEEVEAAGVLVGEGGRVGERGVHLPLGRGPRLRAQR